MTVEHLFTMTAGFSYNFENEPFKKVFKDYDNPTTLQVIESICKSPLISKPGERFNYSFCHDVLAGVIEVASKTPFNKYMQDNIFKPLGLENTDFDFEDKSDFANLYCYNGAFNKLPLVNRIVFSKNWHSGGAGVISTANDYYKFVKTLACGGRELLSAKTLSLINKSRVKSINENSAKPKL
jgi:CubicO group peptidase (beta-lactamase class C family)